VRPKGDTPILLDPLRTVKLAHTVIWGFFVACILAIPFFTLRSRFPLAGLFAAVVAFEVIVLVVNGMRCPLTGVAARYTSERRANFDIYLPEWLARNNKAIFGTLYFAALLLLLVRWMSSR
jgi:hypothetical protein